MHATQNIAALRWGATSNVSVSIQVDFKAALHTGRVASRRVEGQGAVVQAQKTLSELERAIAEARKQCDEATAGECAAAWDTVEELSAAISHKKAQVRQDTRWLLYLQWENKAALCLPTQSQTTVWRSVEPDNCTQPFCQSHCMQADHDVCLTSGVAG